MLLAGKVLARPLFAEDLPALKHNKSSSLDACLEEQPQVGRESFKGFPTGKRDEPAPAVSNLDTADIWKPRISDTGESSERSWKRELGGFESLILDAAVIRYE